MAPKKRPGRPPTKSAAARPSAVERPVLKLQQDIEQTEQRRKSSRVRRRPDRLVETSRSEPARKSRFLDKTRANPTAPELQQNNHSVQQPIPPRQIASPLQLDDGLNSYLVDEELQQDFNEFKQETSNIVQKLLEEIESTSVINFDLRSLWKRTEEILDKILDRGYEPSVPMADATQQKVRRGKADSVAPSETRSSATFFRSRQPLERGQILRSSNIIEVPHEGLTTDCPILAEDYYGAAESVNDNVSTWSKDLERCAYSYEALFQRTICMDGISRWQIQERHISLEYNVEFDWHSPHPYSVVQGTKILVPNPGLPNPKPDLTIGFRPDAFFGPDKGISLVPQELFHHMFPDKREASRDPGRAFPFLLFEVKGSGSSVDRKDAIQQSLINAAHALHNIWMFMKRSAQSEKSFFEHVWVFTVGGHAEKFWLYGHRAVRRTIRTGALSPQYPLSFEFEEIEHFPNVEKKKPYTQANVQILLGKVMSWAGDTLLDLLRHAVDSVCDDEAKAREDVELPSSQRLQRAPRSTTTNPPRGSSTRSSQRSSSTRQHASTKGGKRPSSQGQRNNSRAEPSIQGIAGSSEESDELQHQSPKKQRRGRAPPSTPYDSFEGPTGNTQIMQEASLD